MVSYFRHDLPRVLDQKAAHVSPELAHVAASGPRLANSPTRAERSRLGIRGRNYRQIGGWPGRPGGQSVGLGERKDAKGNYGFVYHLGRVDIFPVAGIEPSALVGDNLKNAKRIGRPRRTRRRPWGAFLPRPGSLAWLCWRLT
jgi:hypothetical protein